MDWVLVILLFLHIGGAILAFGPTYAFLILGPMAGATLTALAIAFGIMLPALRILIPATASPPSAPPAGGVPSGPPRHIVAARSRARLGGMINATLVLLIVFLMVAKPF